MKKALYWNLKDKEKKTVQCILCPRNCVIADGNLGVCGVRKNKAGILYSLVYGNPVSTNIDPIEKKPLFHFLPGSTSFSIGTVGCNLKCLFCQNFDISQQKASEYEEEQLPPEKAVELALANGCKSISYTYTEPTIFYEYVLDTAKLARKKGLKNVMVTNGYINPEPLKELYPFIDGANVDLKGFNPEFYEKYTSSNLENVKQAIKGISKIKTTLLEVTNLVVPGHNDNMQEIEEMCKWLKQEVGDIPLHFSRFFPMYKMQDVEPTPEETLLKAREIAKKYISYVYIGNIHTKDGENTYCPKCKKLLIERTGFGMGVNNIEEGKCKFCKADIAGVWS